jgi:hypothetical protein
MYIRELGYNEKLDLELGEYMVSTILLTELGTIEASRQYILVVGSTPSYIKDIPKTIGRSQLEIIVSLLKIK